MYSAQCQWWGIRCREAKFKKKRFEIVMKS